MKKVKLPDGRTAVVVATYQEVFAVRLPGGGLSYFPRKMFGPGGVASFPRSYSRGTYGRKAKQRNTKVAYDKFFGNGRFARSGGRSPFGRHGIMAGDFFEDNEGDRYEAISKPVRGFVRAINRFGDPVNFNLDRFGRKVDKPSGSYDFF